MTVLEAVISGFVQGLSEFLPISSSGHLALVHAVFGTETGDTNLTFDLFLHLGTLFVVFCFYHKDIFRLISAFFGLCKKIFCGTFRLADRTKDETMLLCLLLATLPLGLGLLVKDRVALLGAYPKLVGMILVFNGFLLLFADFMAKKQRNRPISPLSAVVIGLFQLVALVPGLSRSGSTISGGLFMGLDREEAVKFSFLMSIPAVLGGNLMSIPEVLANPVRETALFCALIGMATAVISGFLAMKLLAYLARRSRFGVFAYYCMLLGIFTVFFSSL